jgi:hypothetical protein
LIFGAAYPAGGCGWVDDIPCRGVDFG